MNKDLLSKNNILLSLLGVSLFVLGITQSWYVYGLVGILLLVGIIFLKKEIVSKQLFWYLVVMVLMGATLFWSDNKEFVFKNFALFLLGGGWMYVGTVVGKDKGLENKLAWLITSLGLGWLFIFLGNELFFEGAKVGSRGLVWWGTHTKDHHHLGDWWAMVVLSQLWILKYGKKLKNKYVNLFLILVGIVWIYFSRSRSAILSVVGGIVLMFGTKKISKEKIVRWVVGFLVMAFLLLGMTKPTFLNRQYWIQGLVGWWRNPLGLGMGNFGELSGDVRNHLFGLKSYSSVAHNVLLEFLAGMGILGLLFWWWAIKFVVEPFTVRKVRQNLMSGLVLALGINFMFDMTYFNGSMWWIFMFLLGTVI
jgi:hypothetical protein